MSARGMSPDAFAGALMAVVPRDVEPMFKAIYLDASTQLHEAVVVPTPVDTGYLRAGFTASVANAAPQTLGPRDEHALYALDTLDAETVAALAAAARTLTLLVMGFTADYATYVEDWAHMVADARAQWDVIVQRAIANQTEKKKAT